MYTPKRIELLWPHKGEHVLQNPETGKWEFCGNTPLPPRPLIEIESYGTEKGKLFGPDSSNLLIKGENLFALEALLPYYTSKVNMIYIDPPFNTGQDFEAYDDNFEHSVWLSMMEKRLDVSRKLLASGGIIAVHLNFIEQPYVRVILDNLFGRKSFVSQISWQRAPDRTVLGQGSALINDNVEYIILYANETVRNDLHIPQKAEPISLKTLKSYSKVLEISNEKSLSEEFIDSSGNIVKIYKHLSYNLLPLGIKNIRSAFFQTDAEFETLFPQIVRLTNQQEESTFQQELLSRMHENDCLYSVVYTQQKGKHKGQRTRFYLNNQVVLFLRDTCKIEDKSIIKVSDLNNFWSDDEISMTGISEEGNVKLKRGKKPEKLLQRIISSFTRDGELILDFFGGSGTTAAVAHKMNRRWLMVELNDQAENLALQRMKRVITGEDQTGVSKQVNWQGGGGFRFLEVGAPLIVEDEETKLTILNPHYTNGPLTRAVCAIEGFLLTGDKILQGRNSDHFAHVTEDYVDGSYVARLCKRLPENGSLTIYALKMRSGLKLPKRVSLKKMQVDLVKPYLRKRK